MGVVILPRLPVLCLPARGCDFIIWIFPSFACSGLVQLPRVRCFLKRVVPCSGVFLQRGVAVGVQSVFGLELI